MYKIILIFLIVFCYTHSQDKIFIKRGDRVLTQSGMKNFEDVINHYEKMKNEFPDSFQIIDDLSYLYFLSEDYTKAIECYKKMINRFPNRIVDISMQYSRCYEEIGNTDSAIYIINQALKYCGNSCSKLFMRLGGIYFGMGDYPRAYKEYLKVDDEERFGNHVYLNNFASVCIKLETNLDQAVKYAQMAVNQHPKYYYYETLGDALFLINRYNEALVAYENALSQMEMVRIREKFDKIKFILKYEE